MSEDEQQNRDGSMPWRRVEVALIETARNVRAAFDHWLAALDLNLNQASILAYLNDLGASGHTELAEMAGVGEASVVVIIEQLEERGLVRRQPGRDDPGAWEVAATDRGVALAERFYAIDAELREALRIDITRSERQQLASLLDRLGSNASSVLETHGPPRAETVLRA